MVTICCRSVTPIIQTRLSPLAYILLLIVLYHMLYYSVKCKIESNYQFVLKIHFGHIFYGRPLTFTKLWHADEPAFLPSPLYTVLREIVKPRIRHSNCTVCATIEPYIIICVNRVFNFNLIKEFWILDL